MSNTRKVITNTNIRNSIASREIIEDEPITINFRKSTQSRFFYIDKSSINRYSTILRQRLRHNFRRGIFSNMNNFSPRIGFLSFICKSNTKVESFRVISLENRTRIEHSYSGTEISSNPFDTSTIFDNSSLCVEIIGIN